MRKAIAREGGSVKDPELRSPREWAEELRNDAEWATETGSGFGDVLHTVTDCRELADRMDDLAEALRLLRDARFSLATKSEIAASRLLAKYADQED